MWEPENAQNHCHSLAESQFIDFGWTRQIVHRTRKSALELKILYTFPHKTDSGGPEKKDDIEKAISNMHMFCTRRLPLLGRPVNMYVRNKRKLYMCNKKVGINFSPRDVVKRIVVVVLVGGSLREVSST